jgi:hypothetical protein
MENQEIQVTEIRNMENQEIQVTEIRNVDELRKPIRDMLAKQLDEYKKLLEQAQNPKQEK